PGARLDVRMAPTPNHKYMKRHRIPLALAALLGGAAPSWSQTAGSDGDIVQMAEFEVTELRAFSDQATLGVTPIAFTEFDKVVLEAELGSRDIPLVLNSSPSIYASAD